MTGRYSPRLSTIWALLAGFTLVSSSLAEGSHRTWLATVTIFVIAAAKGDLILVHYMEARKAQPHWLIMYRTWLATATLLLVGGHLPG